MLSPRLATIVDALPLRPGMRVIEIGCGPGAAARAVAERVGSAGHVLAVDRSARAIAQVRSTAAGLIAAGRLSVRCAPAEELQLEPGEAPYDLASRSGSVHSTAGTRWPAPGPSSGWPTPWCRVACC